jgi:hypothetical protein
MRTIVPAKLAAARDPALSVPEMGLTGAFVLMGPCGTELRIIANDADPQLTDNWEHVSVSTARRCPNWIEMCFVKELFWQDEELVIQFHVPRSQHINNHPYVLHLWRDVTNPHPRMPPAYTVGVQGLSYDEARALGQQWGEEQERIIANLRNG